ncbi:MAG: hypothetical protein GY833_21730 [Aestuariibacter sp.]|nr:hypothetical protein [Aestuariibacter sp.]
MLVKHAHNRYTHFVNRVDMLTLCDLDHPNQVDTSLEHLGADAKLTCPTCVAIVKSVRESDVELAE